MSMYITTSEGKVGEIMLQVEGGSIMWLTCLGANDLNNGFYIFTMHAAKAKDFRYNLSEVLQGRIIEK